MPGIEVLGSAAWRPIPPLPLPGPLDAGVALVLLVLGLTWLLVWFVAVVLLEAGLAVVGLGLSWWRALGVSFAANGFAALVGLALILAVGWHTRPWAVTPGLWWGLAALSVLLEVPWWLWATRGSALSRRRVVLVVLLMQAASYLLGTLLDLTVW